jgi:hypothetical protein
VIKSKQFILVAAAAVMLQAGVALAQDSLEGLLAEVEAARAAEQQTFQQRAAEFNAAAKVSRRRPTSLPSSSPRMSS